MTLSLIPIYNPQNIKFLLAKDDLYKDMFGLENLDRFFPLQHHRYFVTKDGDDLVGLFLVAAETPNSVSYHGGVYKEFRGSSKKYLEFALDMVNKHIPDMIVWTKCSDKNEPAKRIIKSVGFKQTGVIPKAANGDNLLIFTKDE